MPATTIECYDAGGQAPLYDGIRCDVYNESGGLVASANNSPTTGKIVFTLPMSGVFKCKFTRLADNATWETPFMFRFAQTNADNLSVPMRFA